MILHRKGMWQGGLGLYILTPDVFAFFLNSIHKINNRGLLFVNQHVSMLSTTYHVTEQKGTLIRMPSYIEHDTQCTTLCCCQSIKFKILLCILCCHLGKLP